MTTLPASAQAILNRIKSEDADFIALNASRQRQLREIKSQKAEAASRLHVLEREDRAGRLVKQHRTGDVVEVTRNQAALNDLHELIAGYDRRIAELQTSTAPERLTAQRIDNELAKFGRATFVAVERPALPKKERPAEYLDHIRFYNDGLRRERKKIEQLPRTTAEAKKAARATIAAIVRVPQVAGLFQNRGIIWPQRTLYLSSSQQREAIDAAGLLAFAFQDELAKKIDALIDFNASAFPGGISESERATKLAELDARIAEGERLEAAAVEAVVAEGGEAYHRPLSNVLTALGIAVA